VYWKRLLIKENYQLIPYICSGTAIGTPNATLQAPLEAGATQERTL
jgi:hypothetical protein